MPDHKAPMGSLAWADRTGGRLTRRDRIALLRNIALIQIQGAMDSLRTVLGTLAPTPITWNDVVLPDTRLIDDALELACTTQSPALLRHSWRTYYYGVAIAAFERLNFDAEHFLAAALLHDTGLTDAVGLEPLNTCCFAVGGARCAHTHLTAKGHAPKAVDPIAEAISLHLNLRVNRHRHGTEAYLLARGAVCDVFGVGRRRIAAQSIADILTLFPRDGLNEALGFGTAPHLADTRADFMGRLFGGKAPPDAFRHFTSQGEHSCP